MRENLDRIAPFLPLVGLLMLVAGGVASLFSSTPELLTYSLLALGVILLLLFVILRPDEIRRLAGGRQARYGTMTAVSIILFTGIAVLLYMITRPFDSLRADLTATNELTPLDETIELLKGFDEPIDVIGFYSTSSTSRRLTAEERLRSLRAYKSDLSFEFADPNADPLLAQQYDVTADSTLVFIRNRDQENEITSQAATTTDRDMHTALVRLINPRTKNAYFLTGHGEMAPTSFTAEDAGEIAGYIEDQGFTVQQLNLAVEGAVPGDADVVVALGARAPMDEIEVAALNDYLTNGGAAFIARDYPNELGQIAAEEDNLKSMLVDEWGIQLRPDFVIELDQRLAGQQLPIVFFSINFGSSPIISDDMNDLGILFSFARSIGIQEAAGVTYVELASSSEDSWGETNIEAPQLGEGDFPGPVAVAVSAENSSTGGRIVVVGDVDFLSNEVSNRAANALFFSNSMNWLVGDETALTITPRETIERTVTLPQDRVLLIQIVSCLTGPALVALIGIAVWFNRRRTR